MTEIHLLAQPLGHDRDVDVREKLMRVRAQAAAVERGQDAAPAAGLGVVDRGVGLVAVEMERAAAVEVQRRQGVQVMVVAAAHDGALAAVRHDEGERRFAHLPVMDRDAVFRRHVDEHAAEPVVGDRVSRSGAIPSLAQAKAAVTALPPNEIAYSSATAFSSPVGISSVRKVTSI